MAAVDGCVLHAFVLQCVVWSCSSMVSWICTRVFFMYSRVGCDVLFSSVCVVRRGFLEQCCALRQSSCFFVAFDAQRFA